MDKIKQSFQESDLFRLVANYPEAIANAVIEKLELVDEEKVEVVKEAFLELGFHLTSAASASYRLTHAVDIMRNQGAMGPDIRYVIMESASELTNAVTLTEPAVRCAETLVKLGEDLDEWETEIPETIPDDGVDILYVRNFKDVVKGKLINFRYTDIENKTVITDIACIYDPQLFAYMPLTNNPTWKYVNETGDTTERNENTGSTSDADAKESEGPTVS